MLKANSSARNLVINPIQDINANNLHKLGRQFLSSAYIIVNQDAGRFTIWPSHPTNDMDLVAVGKDSTEVTDFCGSATISSPTSPEAKASPSPSGWTGPASLTKSQRPGSSTIALLTGAIAGIIIGSVFIAATIAVAAFLSYRHRRKVLGAAKATSLPQWQPKAMPPVSYPHSLTSDAQSYSKFPLKAFRVHVYQMPELHGAPLPLVAEIGGREQYELGG
jgi:hypothetical protein